MRAGIGGGAAGRSRGVRRLRADRCAPNRTGDTRDAQEKSGPEGPLQIADKPSPSAGFLFFNGVMLKTPMPTQ
ncbi:hypothetical protein, partial [Burkholderia pseudomallei]|uniref:hypothetical protein n=1 Tax=Burkholderia pseudomallei TaxID=28450 RepID=UPI00217F81A7